VDVIVGFVVGLASVLAIPAILLLVAWGVLAVLFRGVRASGRAVFGPSDPALESDVAMFEQRRNQLRMYLITRFVLYAIAVLRNSPQGHNRIAVYRNAQREYDQLGYVLTGLTPWR